MKTKSVQLDELRMKPAEFDKIMSKAFQITPKASSKKKKKSK